MHSYTRAHTHTHTYTRPHTPPLHHTQISRDRAVEVAAEVPALLTSPAPVLAERLKTLAELAGVPAGQVGAWERRGEGDVRMVRGALCALLYRTDFPHGLPLQSQNHSRHTHTHAYTHLV